MLSWISKGIVEIGIVPKYLHTDVLLLPYYLTDGVIKISWERTVTFSMTLGALSPWNHSSYTMKTNWHAHKKINEALDKKRKRARAAKILISFVWVQLYLLLVCSLVIRSSFCTGERKWDISFLEFPYFKISSCILQVHLTCLSLGNSHCGRMNYGPQRYPVHIPGTIWMLLISKGTLQMWLYQGIWDRVIILDYLTGSHAIIRVLIKGREDNQKRRRQDHRYRSWSDTLWKWRRWTKSQATQVVSKHWKRQGIGIFPGVPRRTQSCQ